MGVPREIERAAATGQPIRVHTADGEVFVGRLLAYDEEAITYIALSSSHPERYAVCDSTGFSIRFEAIERVVLLREAGSAKRG